MYKLLLPMASFSFLYAVSLPQSVPVQNDYSFWIALFALAIIGVLSLFVSSEQMKKINAKHDSMIKIQSQIEEKQQLILESMSEKIEVSTKGIVLHKEVLQQHSFDNMTESFFEAEMERFEESQSLLLDATHELVDFLQVKSGHLEIKEESYHLSNMLNETYGLISERLKTNKIELLYDIDPGIATELKGDSRRIEQVLSILLKDISNDVKNSLVSLNILLEEKKQKVLCFTIHNKEKKITPEEMKSLFSNYALSEEYKSKEKIDLYIAYELVKHMGGSLIVQSDKEGTSYKIELPYQPQKFSLFLSVKTEDKKFLVLEKEQEVGDAIANMIRQHDTSVEVYDAQGLKTQTPNFYNYDMIFVNRTLLTPLMISKLDKVRSKKRCQVVELRNIYNKDQLLDVEKRSIDITLQKPLQNEQIFDVLEKMLDTEEIDTYKEPKLTLIKETAGVDKNSFSKFSHIDVLIAEDNKINQKILSGVLHDSGMNITMVSNGEEALNVVKQNRELDLIFMNTNMPTMDGYEATKKIRELYNDTQLPIVAISGVGFQNDLDKMANAGANAYIHKPFQVGDLYSAFVKYAPETKSKIKNINHKLTKYEGNKEVLDIQKGISHSQSAIFYKELLQEVLVNLNSSNILVTQMIMKREDRELKSFIANTLRVAEKIGAKPFAKILTEINQLFIYKNENQIQEYMPLYTKEWNRVKKEIEEYLKC